MKFLFILFIDIILIFLINVFFKKKKILLNYNGQKHQKHVGFERVPLTGGIFIFIFISLSLYDINLSLVSFLSLFLLLGLIGDQNTIKSPLIRFLLQIVSILIFVNFYELKIYDLRFELIDKFLLNSYFQFFFITFCLLIFLNGSNFIDGNNVLASGYFLILISSVLYLNYYFSLDLFFDLDFLFYLGFTIFIITILNAFNYIYLGDNGIYIISIFFGFLLIKFYELNPEISPYFIATLLSYPSFELLFSIIRKIKKKKSALEPDTDHLHQLLFLILKRKIKKNYLSNVSTGLLINFYNVFIVYMACQNIYSTKYQLSLIILNIFIYNLLYLILFKFSKNEKNFSYR